MANIKRLANERNTGSHCTKRSHDAGVEYVLSVADQDPHVAAIATLFGIVESNAVVVLCDKNGSPVTNDELSKVLEFTSNTGGSPPRAGYNGYKWVLMPLGMLRSIDHKCIFYFLQPFGDRTTNEREINKQLPAFEKWSFSRISRPSQVGSKYVPGPAFHIDTVSMVDMMLAVLNDAIEANDARLTCAMVHSIHNTVEKCKLPRLENPMDPGSLADDLAAAMYDRQFATTAKDCDKYATLRANAHPWDWFAALRLIVCGMATAPGDVESSTALYERSVMENRNNVVLSMLFDGNGMKDAMSPFFIMRILTDNVRTTNQVSPVGSTVDEVTFELLTRIETKLPQMRAGFLVLSVSSLSRLSLWSVRNAEKYLGGMHDRAKSITSVPNAVLAMYPDVQPFADHLHYTIANLVLIFASLGRTDMKGKMVTPEFLLTSTVPSTLLDFVKTRSNAKATTVLNTIKSNKSASTWSDFKKNLNGRLDPGASETVREVYERLAFELMSGGVSFVKDALGDEDFFMSSRTMLRFLRPLLGAPYSDNVFQIRKKMARYGRCSKPTHLEVELAEMAALAKSTAISRSASFGIPLSDLGYCENITAHRHALKTEVHRTFKDFDPTDGGNAKKDKTICLFGVSPIDPFSMVALRTQIECCVALAEELHACPICFETDGNMVDLHVENAHPDDYKVCSTCRAQLVTCPFCRVRI